jgi:hypothetical protein
MLKWIFPDKPIFIYINSGMELMRSPLGPLRYYDDDNAGMVRETDLLHVLTELTKRWSLAQEQAWKDRMHYSIVQAILKTSDRFKNEECRYIDPWSADPTGYCLTYNQLLDSMLRELSIE